MPRQIWPFVSLRTSAKWKAVTGAKQMPTRKTRLHQSASRMSSK
jgi:hypothetical protein